MALAHDRPDGALGRELREVAAHARALIDAIGDANAPLPETFPRSELTASAPPEPRLKAAVAAYRFPCGRREPSAKGAGAQPPRRLSR
jgi:hypothetical protein